MALKSAPKGTFSSAIFTALLCFGDVLPFLDLVIFQPHVVGVDVQPLTLKLPNFGLSCICPNPRSGLFALWFCTDEMIQLSVRRGSMEFVHRHDCRWWYDHHGSLGSEFALEGNFFASYSFLAFLIHKYSVCRVDDGIGGGLIDVLQAE